MRDQQYELTDQQWVRLEPLLPPPRTGRPGRPCHPHRPLVEGIFWLARTGAPWRDLPERFGNWRTVCSRFYRWVKRGVWTRVLKVLQRQSDVAGRLDWRTHFVDSTHVRAHQHAAGARRVHGGPEEQSLGRSRGGFGTKVHVRAEGGGKPLVLLLTPGQRHEQTVFEALMTGGTIRREGRGRPRRRPTRVVGDRGYSGRSVRQYLRARGIAVAIPYRRNERWGRPVAPAIYRERNRVERCMNRLKQFRRAATRYEKLAANYLAMITLAAIRMWV